MIFVEKTYDIYFLFFNFSIDGTFCVKNHQYFLCVSIITGNTYTPQCLPSFFVSWRKKHDYSLVWILSPNSIIHSPVKFSIAENFG